MTPNLEQQSNVFTSRITRKVLTRVVTFSFAIFLTLTTTQVGYHYFKGQRQIIDELRDTVLLHEQTLARSIWTYNRFQLKVEVEGYLQRKYIVGVEVEDEDGTLLIKRGAIDTESPFQFKRKIIHRDNNGPRTIGAITIFGSDDELVSTLYQVTVELLFLNFVRALVVTGFLAMLIHKTVIARINKLHRAVQKLSRQDTLTSLAGNEYPLTKHPDELDDLWLSFQESRRKLGHSFIEIQEKQRELEIAARAKTSFLAMVSHEMRTPLTNVINHTSLARSSKNELNQEDMERVLASVQGSGEHLLRLINDIIDYISFNSDKVRIETQTVELREIFSRLEELYLPQAKSLGIALEFDLPRTTPPIVSDATRILQILINLTNNAIRFTDKSNGWVKIRAKLKEASTDKKATLVLNVSDNGPGIDAKTRKYITRPFYQLESSINRSHGGLGLGLAIVNKIIESLNGTLNLESTPGQGSSFQIELPVYKAPINTNSTVEETGFDLPNKRECALVSSVLIIDDNDQVRFIVGAILKHLGFRNIQSVSSGKAAVKALSQSTFQLVLLDIQMPEMSGWEVASYYSAQHPEKRKKSLVLALTALSNSEFEAREEAKEFDDMLSKPISTKKLKKILAEQKILK